MKKAGPDVQDDVGRWYQAVVGRMRSRNWLQAAEQFLASGRDRWPREPIVLYESGTLEEFFAGDTSCQLSSTWPLPERWVRLRRCRPRGRRHRSRAAPLTTSSGIGSQCSTEGRMASRGAQARSVERAGCSPLGRVQMLRNHHAEALELLGQASRSSNLAVAYLGLLFTAALHERQGRRGRGSTGVRRRHCDLSAQPGGVHRTECVAPTYRARRSVPRAPAWRRGCSPASRREPWWTYFHEPPAVELARLEALRRETRQ